MMLGLSTARLRLTTHFPISSRRRTSTPRLVSLSKLPQRDYHYFVPKSDAQIRTRLVLALANKNDNDSRKEENDEFYKERQGIGFNGGDDNDGSGKEENGRSIFSGIRWGDLLVSSDPDNILAVGLTGLLTWASVQVLWQLLFISLAILVAAVKYSLIAALLIFILITLL